MLLRIRSTRTLSIAKAAHMPCGQRKAGQERAHAGSPVGSAGLLVCRPRLGPSHAPTMQQMVAPAVAQQNSASGGEGEPGPRSPVAPLRNSSDMSSHTTRTPPRSNSLRRGRVSSGQECGTDQAARRAARLPCGGQAGWRKRSRGRGRGAGTCGGQQAAAAQWRSARTHKPKLSAPPPPLLLPCPSSNTFAPVCPCRLRRGRCALLDGKLVLEAAAAAALHGHAQRHGAPRLRTARGTVQALRGSTRSRRVQGGPGSARSFVPD